MENSFLIDLLGTPGGRTELKNCIAEANLRDLRKIKKFLEKEIDLKKEDLEEMVDDLKAFSIEILGEDNNISLSQVDFYLEHPEIVKKKCRNHINLNYKSKLDEIEKIILEGDFD